MNLLEIFGEKRKLVGLDHILEWREKYFRNPFQNDFLFIDFFDFSLFQKSPFNSFIAYILNKIIPYYSIVGDILRPLSIPKIILEKANLTINEKFEDSFEELFSKISFLKEEVLKFKDTKFPMVKELKKEEDVELKERYKSINNEIRNVSEKLTKEIIYNKKEALQQQLESLGFEKKLVDDSLQFEKRKPSFEITYQSKDISFLTIYLEKVERKLMDVRNILTRKKYLSNVYSNLFSNIEEMDKKVRDVVSNFSWFEDFIGIPLEKEKQKCNSDTIEKVINNLPIILNSIFGSREVNIVFCDFPFIFKSTSNVYSIQRFEE